MDITVYNHFVMSSVNSDHEVRFYINGDWATNDQFTRLYYKSICK